jgi:addiction module HigA family antidote
MTVTDVAHELDVTRQTMHRILSESTAITPEMALRLGKFCGNSPDLWLRMQVAYDLWHARQRLATELEQMRRAKVA